MRMSGNSGTRTGPLCPGKPKTAPAAVRLACALICIAAPALAELSASEQAARSERPPTQAEIEQHEAGCAFAPRPTRDSLQSDGLSFPVVELDPAEILVLLQVVATKNADKFDISRFSDLPDGGIAGKDTCFLIEIEGYDAPVQTGAPIRSLGLQLRADLDLLALYPNTGAVAEERNQVVRTDGGRFALVDLRDPENARWYEAGGGTLAIQDKTRLVRKMGEILFVPVR